jgi:hypothetical protein
MDNRITGAKIFQIAMDPKRTYVVEQLSYDNNMLYLPLPEPPECISASTSLDNNNIVIAPIKNQETRPGHLNT